MRVCRTCLLPEGPDRKIASNRLECNPCRGKRYYDADPARARAAAARGRAKNPEYYRAWSKAYAARNKERIWARELSRRYGLEPEDYFAMKEAQNGLCAICQTVPKRFHVDHCHATGKVRGMLCSACNSGIGMLKDDPTILRAAIAYLS